MVYRIVDNVIRCLIDLDFRESIAASLADKECLRRRGLRIGGDGDVVHTGGECVDRRNGRTQLIG